MRLRRPTPTFALLAALAVVLAACGDDDEVGTGGSTTSRPTGAGAEVIVTLDVHGGFVPVERAVADTAEVVALGDGRVISPAPTIAIFPGPAFPPFQVSRADVEDVAAVAAAVEALDPEADYGQPAGGPMVADAPDTTVSLERDGEVVRSVTANALGSDGESGPRAELAAVVEQIQALVTGQGDEPYEPTAIRVYDVTELAGEPPATTTTAADEPPGEPTGRILDWPLEHDGAACTVIDDPGDVAAALEVLAEATQLDWFRTDAGVRRLVAVPVLPGRDGCPDPG